jgi:ankyrin repeat protein
MNITGTIALGTIKITLCTDRRKKAPPVLSIIHSPPLLLAPFLRLIYAIDLDSDREATEREQTPPLRSLDTVEQLLEAVALGDYGAVKTLLHDQEELLTRCRQSGKSPLHRALLINEKAIAELLLDHGAPIEEIDSTGATPLHRAVFENNLPLALLLLARGADRDAYDKGGCTPLILAARDGHREMAALLLDHGADLQARDRTFQATALHRAVLGGHLALAELLTGHGADVNMKDGSGRRALRIAHDGDNREMAEYLKSRGARK